MTKRCRRCKHFLGGNKAFCLSCKRILNKAKREVANIIIAKPKPKIQTPEVYLGKKEECGYCGKVTHLYRTKKFSKKVCQECKGELESMGIKITGKAQLPDITA